MAESTSLEVCVKSAQNLPNVDGPGGKSDPFVVITFQGQKKQTKWLEDQPNPEWNETLMWELRGPLEPTEHLKVLVLDHERFGRPQFIGEADVPLSEAVQSGTKLVQTELKDSNGNTISDAILTMEITYHGNHSADDGASDEEQGRAPRLQRRLTSKRLSVRKKLKIIEPSASTDAESEDDGVAPGQPFKIADMAEFEQRDLTQSARANLPDKATDFQVRVHIIEGRKLEGEFLKAMVKVFVGGQSKETPVRQGTNSPYWNETMIFNFKELPDLMMDKVVEIRALNTRKLLKDALIGSFKFDVGMAYNEPEHCFIHKWLVLTDPDDSSGGAKGYVKFSINVIGPGDEPTPSPATMSPDNVDIEANVLRQSGTRLQPGSLIVRIYRGSDLPQMDPVYFEKVKKLFNSKAKPKNLVDPYCLVSYAGHRGKTPVVWNNQDPQWNHQINLSVRFPLLSERIRLRLKDKDRSTVDDIIATTYLKLSQMSSTGESGFPPTFGPCYVNFYGAPREFNDRRDLYEYLNKGVVEGVSYRGRMMVEIVTETGKLPTETHHTIGPNDVKAIEPFLKQHKYKLCAAFLSATLIEPYNHNVEFEVSIGNWGNKLEERLSVQTSTTPALKPISDGNAYYSMPWFDKKPVVVVDSEWEDCTYRIETLNLLLGVERELEEGLTLIRKVMMDTSIPATTPQRRLAGLLTGLSDKMKDVVRWLDPSTHASSFPEIHTTLDKLLRERRLNEMRILLKEVNKLLTYHTVEMEMAELNEMLKECDNMLGYLKTLATEPQNSIPDVIIWMLCGEKRVATCRIPSHLLMYSTKEVCKGHLCGRTQTIFLQPPTVQGDEDSQKVAGRALLQVMLWLGRDGDHRGWTASIPDGEYSVYAETYENESCLIAGPWSSNLLSRVPHWSDMRGKTSLPQESFIPPEGWKWDGGWELSPEVSVAFDADEGRTEWTEEIFETQEREVEFAWPDESIWTTYSGDDLSLTTAAATDGTESVAGSVAGPPDPSQAHQMTMEDIECPIGWKWSKPWQVDQSRGDSEGWEYSTSPDGPEWVTSERTNHTSRRRKWVRPRVVVHDPRVQKQKKDQLDQRLREGWEYARGHKAPFHARKTPLDFARRRRYLRKMVADDITKPVVFKFVNAQKGKKKIHTQVPRHYLTFKDYHRYQLRVYLYQARDLYGSDQSGLSDPYCILSLGSKSTRSITMEQTVTPRWEETLVLDVRIYGDPHHLVMSPPMITLEFYDSDRVGDEHIGWSYCHPCVRLTPRATAPELEWHQITRFKKSAGEVLAAFELLLDDGTLKMDLPPGTAPKKYSLPDFIKPEIRLRRIEFLCWGVREMKRHHLQAVNSPFVELECGGSKVQGNHIEDASKNPNFPGPKTSITLDLEIPVKDIFAPPINLTVYDRRFNRVSKVAVHSIKTLSVYCVDPTTTERQRTALAAAASTKDKKGAGAIAIEMPNFDPDSMKTAEFDWWSKYYCSIDDPIRKQKKYEDDGYDKIVLYNHELEKEFNNFEDILKSFPLFRGKGAHDADEDPDQVVGHLKGALKVYPIMDGPSEVFGVLSNEPVQCLVRVYIIRGIDLQPLDPGGKSDPYIRLKIGKHEINDKENYIPNQLNPTFGKVFEVPALIPLDHTLHVTVMDWDLTSADDLIGTTTIDLENRLISQHRATCGLPETYCKRGVCAWRDSEHPSEILEKFCRLHHLPEPEWRGDRVVVVDGVVHDLTIYERGKKPHQDLGSERERVALYALQFQEQVLVPEHVETRTLYNPAQPGISQGSLHMWVDIFPRQGGVIPPPVNITPRKPEKFFLRIVVWNTVDVELNETSVVTGEDMSDIYVKGWLQGQDKTQKTDVHYRSLDGEGNFNWRFVFEFEYLPSEHVMVIKKKEHFYSLDKTESFLPPRITMQVWDNDLISADDFIGTIDMNLHEMPRPSVSAAACTLELLPEFNPQAEIINLFEQKTVKGFWPVWSNRKEGKELTGKLELEMELVSAEEHEQRPAGKARDEPNANPVLSPPNRPATSFFWFSSPLKTLRFVVWRQFKWPIMIGAVLLLVAIGVAIFIYTAPGHIMNFITSNLIPTI